MKPVQYGPIMQTIPSRSGMMSVVFAEVLTAILLLVEGFLLLDAANNGLTGSGTLVISGGIAFIWALLSFVAAYGLRSGKKWSWNLAIVLSIVAIVLSAGLIALAAVFTGTLTYPGLAIVLLLIVNDTIIAEVAVSYLLTKADVRAQFRKNA
ncbi:MAG TPA: hypothetical protein VNA15_03960 [Candidatus Angelobacter sp.]|nr:hypothetical protein [Candidatus Angelobacter sp.]